MENNEQTKPSRPHVLIFPLPIQGRVNPMLKLAELLALAGGFKITFLNAEHNHARLLKFNNDFNALLTKYPEFEFKTITDGLPKDHPRSFDRFPEVYNAMETNTKPSLRDLLLNIKPPVDCIIADQVLGFAVEVAKELRIPLFYYTMGSPCYIWAFNSIPDIIQAGELPITGIEDLDRLITSIPGMESLLRVRDLPHACRVKSALELTIPRVVKQGKQSAEAKALILNTFEDLDGPILSQIRTKFPHLYPIGPIHAQLNTRLELEAKNGQQPKSSQSQYSNSLFEVDRSCISWLDKQPKQSVIYVSLGSLTITSREQHTELWYGLVNSKKRFLWVVRPDSVTGKDGCGEDVVAELLEGTKERGYIVGWAPQEEVLNHPAVGSFLTHSGWNSTIETIVVGLPMICWPNFSDQYVNSRFVSEVWKLGLDMKDVCDRKVVEKMVNDVMEDRREEFVKSAAEMAKLAKQSVSVGGSSFCCLDRLIQDIRLMTLQKSHENS